MNEKQSEELHELIQSINSCDTGQQALQSIFQEAESAGAGEGEMLRGIWEQDVSDAKWFYHDQQQNGECINV